VPASNHSDGSNTAFSLVSSLDSESGHTLKWASEARRPGEPKGSDLVYSAQGVKAAISFPANLI